LINGLEWRHGPGTCLILSVLFAYFRLNPLVLTAKTQETTVLRSKANALIIITFIAYQDEQLKAKKTAHVVENPLESKQSAILTKSVKIPKI
jgi:hypothetical protein